MHHFPIDYSATDNSDILNIYKYLMVKNNIKQCLDFLNKCLLDYLFNIFNNKSHGNFNNAADYLPAKVCVPSKTKV